MLKFVTKITAARLIAGAAIFMTLFFNFRFFKNTTGVYPIIWANIPFLCSIAVVFACLMVFALTLICSKYTLKPILILLLMVSSVIAYFMDTYNVIIDAGMVQNLAATDVYEIKDLFSFKLLAYFMFLGLLPSVFIYKVQVIRGSLKTELIKKAKYIILSLMILTCLLFSFSRFYTSFFREHRILRYYTNPTAWITATAKYIRGTTSSDLKEIRPIGIDAKNSAADTGRQLIILVVGEAVRADRLSLNGYFRETTPLLQQEEVISFSNMYACGTTTVISVPCMFSVYGRKDFSREKGNGTENLLDVLTHAGVHVLWLDNNSSSKGVALRVPYEDYRHPDKNPVCIDGECRDEGMLAGLQAYIDA
ncbi:MAG: phosphoethanolamine transferase domain-containing protein, partial [Desulfosalsimonadaceae bacterium]|nr:phosphoethanolamine transferase domain-containing protein [Desulfosalsimonadaceae bacterium]